MDLLPIFFIALSLSADCFAVALSGGIAMRTVSPAQMLRVSFAFGLSQFIMPILGWLAGRTIVGVISAYDHWATFGLLVIVGGRMIRESLRPEEDLRGADITRGLTLVGLSVATSLDSLAVGLSFAFLEVSIIMASLTIGIIAFIVTASGFLLSRKVSKLVGRRAKLVGGVILIAIGLRILLSHLYA